MITRRSGRLSALADKKPKEETSKDVGTSSKATEKPPEPKATGSQKRQRTTRAKGPPKTQEKPQPPPVVEKQKRNQKSKNRTDVSPQENPRKKLKRDAINFHDNEPDPIIEHLRETSKSHPSRSLSIDHAILDQIALEGLMGVKIGRLFRLLEATVPCFKCTSDFDCQNYVWSVIVRRYLSGPERVKVYLDETCIEPQIAENEPASNPRGLYIDKEFKLPQQTLKWCGTVVSTIYPVQDGIVMGSCCNYTSRLDITEELSRKAVEDEFSFAKAVERYNFEKVYLVADQKTRSETIYPNWADPNVDIKLREYCVLELIGRTRTLGAVFPKDKTLGRYRLMLLAKGFITQYQVSNSSAIEHHLKRFSFVKQSLAKCPTSKAVEVCSEDEDEDIERSLGILCCDPGKLKPDRSTLTLVYDTIAQSSGISQIDIRREMNFPKFHIRNHLKNLISIKMICSQTSTGHYKPFRFYKTAYKSVRRKRIREELAKPTGIMAKWDEADLRAKKIIGHRRSSFSQAEDSLLILCRITSILIEPKCRLSWCVHKRVIRDILHEELVESHNKTSDACLRRIKYLKRLSNNIMSINELTAELQDDPDIQRLTECDRPIESDNKMHKLFTQVLKTVRAKIPNLLGIASTISSRRLAAIGVAGSGNENSNIEQLSNGEARERLLVNLDDHKELQEKYELVDCQSVASIVRAPTYEKAKNVVDVKFNNASLVTMAFTLSSCLSGRGSEEAKTKQKVYRWLLDKFYSGYHDKLISSVLSKLNKRSLLTRKCPAEQASLYKPKTRTSLKLNQSVLFSLTRYHSTSLIQLAAPLGQPDKIELSESNEMSSIALLASLCSFSSFETELKLKIPTNVVGIDQGNENFKSLWDRANEETREILARFMSRCGEPVLATNSSSIAANRCLDSAPIATSTLNEEPSTSRGSPTVSALRTITDSRIPVASHSTAGTNADGNKASPTSKAKTDCAIELPSPPPPPPATTATATTSNNKMDDSRSALSRLRHELKAHALDKCGSLSDCLIVQPCNVKFSSSKQLKPTTKPLESFLRQAQARDLIDAEREQRQQTSPPKQQQPLTNWLVKSFRLPCETSGDFSVEKDLESKKINIEYSARLWKRIDGSVHLLSLFKLMESLLSWIVVFPGVEYKLLQREFDLLMPEEHLSELLELMERLKLISSHPLQVRHERPRLFGYRKLDGKAEERVVVFEASDSAFVRYCQLLSSFLPQEREEATVG